MFGCVMKVIKSYQYKLMRLGGASDMAWTTIFKGKVSEDGSGPFRETIENVVDKIQSSTLPLLTPTQNYKNNHGFNRDCWTINPSSTSPHYLKMYKFLGALIGMAISWTLDSHLCSGKHSLKSR